MAAKVYYEADADSSIIRNRKVAIIGYGSQGHAHALNLHESGVEVVVGLAPGSKSRTLASDAGLLVLNVADAVKAADVIMILVPDTAQKAVYDAEIGPNLRPGHLRPGRQPLPCVEFLATLPTGRLCAVLEFPDPVANGWPWSRCTKKDQPRKQLVF